jgi:hypothetical protein
MNTDKSIVYQSAFIGVVPKMVQRRPDRYAEAGVMNRLRRVLNLLVWCRINLAALVCGMGSAPALAYGSPVERTSNTVSSQ